MRCPYGNPFCLARGVPPGTGRHAPCVPYGSPTQQANRIRLRSLEAALRGRHEILDFTPRRAIVVTTNLSPDIHIIQPR